MTWLVRPRPDAIPSTPVEARDLIGQLMDCADPADINRIKVWVGNAQIQIPELLQITQIDGPGHELYLEGDFRHYHGLGWKLKSGKIMINGNTGARLGAEMEGGSIELCGDCGAWAGVAMSGGRLFIQGNAGRWLGANWPGESKGMRGGEILVQGDTGDHTGACMRRGTIAVAGSSGFGLGRDMIAGSIFVAGNFSDYPGMGMKRGSIVLANEYQNHGKLLSSFSPDGHARPLTLDMQLKYLAQKGWTKANELLQRRYCTRFFGDNLSLGLGEIIFLSDNNSGKK